MSLIDIEFGNWGSIVFLVAIVAFVLIWLGGATSIGLLAGAIMIALLAAVLYYTGVRVDYWIRHGRRSS